MKSKRIKRNEGCYFSVMRACATPSLDLDPEANENLEKAETTLEIFDEMDVAGIVMTPHFIAELIKACGMNGLVAEAHEFYRQGTSMIYDDHRNSIHPSFPQSDAAKRDAADRTEKEVLQLSTALVHSLLVAGKTREAVAKAVELNESKHDLKRMIEKNFRANGSGEPPCPPAFTSAVNGIVLNCRASRRSHSALHAIFVPQQQNEGGSTVPSSWKKAMVPCHLNLLRLGIAAPDEDAVEGMQHLFNASYDALLEVGTSSQAERAPFLRGLEQLVAMSMATDNALLISRALEMIEMAQAEGLASPGICELYVTALQKLREPAEVLPFCFRAAELDLQPTFKHVLKAFTCLSNGGMWPEIAALYQLYKGRDWLANCDRATVEFMQVIHVIPCLSFPLYLYLCYICSPPLLFFIYICICIYVYIECPLVCHRARMPTNTNCQMLESPPPTVLNIYQYRHSRIFSASVLSLVISCAVKNAHMYLLTGGLGINNKYLSSLIFVTCRFIRLA
jgi:hypothetical protein